MVGAFSRAASKNESKRIEMIDCASCIRSPVRSLLVVLSLSAIASGCSDEKRSKSVAKPRASASGNVSYEGKPLAAGTVNFTSKDTGNTASCPIDGGSYACKSADGPNPGENYVVIVWKEENGAGWTWKSNADVPETGYTGDFAVK